MSPLLTELEELYARSNRLDQLRTQVKERDDHAVRKMLYFNIWKHLRELRGLDTLAEKTRVMEDTLEKLETKVNLQVTYG